MSAVLRIASLKHPAATSVAASGSRDLRLDFFRGVALLMIFVDHVSGNKFAALTLQSMGFADAAEVFVFIAGMAGVHAYRKTMLKSGFLAGCSAIFSRIRTLYLAHVGMVAGVLLVALLAHLGGTGFDIIRKLGLQPLLDDPAAAMTRLPMLAYLPHYLDILPLYVVLLATLPLILQGQRIHVLLPLGAAMLSYAAAHTWGLTLPNLGHADGWFLNPFAWILLFALGATTAKLGADSRFEALPRWVVVVVTVAAATYVVFAFLHAAPWRVFPALEPYVATSLVLEPNKAALSWHRLLDLLGKAWLVAVLVPRDASFMVNGLGGTISRAGRHSLAVFVAGTFLALIGSVVLYEGGGTTFWQVAVTGTGVLILLLLAAGLDNRSALPGFGTQRVIGHWPLYRISGPK
jgi:hypothetical protein